MFAGYSAAVRGTSLPFPLMLDTKIQSVVEYWPCSLIVVPLFGFCSGDLEKKGGGKPNVKYCMAIMVIPHIFDADDP